MNIQSFLRSKFLTSSNFLIQSFWALVFAVSCFLYQPIALAQNVFPESGNVGIGTTNPQESLHVRGRILSEPGSLQLRNPSTNNGWRIGGNNGGRDLTFITDPANGNSENRVTFDQTGRVGIGTQNPDHELVIQGNDPAVQIRDDTTDNSENAARLELLERAGGQFDGGAFLWWNGDSNKLLIGTKNNGINTNVLVINRAGSNVGIGTSNPSANDRLAVNGRIRAKEIVVETGWSDFVFNPDYTLNSLSEVERYIHQHGHLPDIPSATEVAVNGVPVGEMESRLLQKVEELTLHLIDMHKRMQALEQANAH